MWVLYLFFFSDCCLLPRVAFCVMGGCTHLAKKISLIPQNIIVYILHIVYMLNNIVNKWQHFKK